MIKNLLFVLLGLLCVNYSNAQCLQIDGIPDVTLPSTACCGETVSICLPYLSYSGAEFIADFSADQGATVEYAITDTGSELCIDVTPSIPGCEPLDVVVTINNLTCADGGAIEACLPFPCLDIATLGVFPIALDPITVNPTFTEMVVQSACGTLGSAQLVACDGTVCAAETIAVAGVENVCPDLVDVDADLAYDFTSFDNPCFTGTSQASAPIDCAVTCLACPNVTSIETNAASYCHDELVTICVNFDGPADDIDVGTIVGQFFVENPGDTQICFDVTAENMSCSPIVEDYFIVAEVHCSIGDITLPFPSGVPTWTTNPILIETIVQSTCGSAGSASLVSMSGTICAMETLATAGVANVCPDLNDIDADLVYDFTSFTNPCFTGTSQASSPIDCAIACTDILGCIDPCAPNFNPAATMDDGSCEPQLLGCTDPTASNFDAAALCDDGSCLTSPPTSDCEPSITTFPINRAGN